MVPPFDPALARQVTARRGTLEPHQQKAPRNIRTARDFRLQVMRKHPHLSEFHCRAEYLYAGLLEGDPEVIHYTPHPFPLRLHGRPYTPDFYVLRDGRRVVELASEQSMPEKDRTPLEHFFAQHGMKFELMNVESVFERATEAENWLEIVRILHVGGDLDTTGPEQILFERITQHGPCAIGDLIEPSDRERTYPQEIALFRLLHQGHLVAELKERPIDFDTEVALCT